MTIDPTDVPEANVTELSPEDQQYVAELRRHHDEVLEAADSYEELDPSYQQLWTEDEYEELLWYMSELKRKGSNLDQDEQVALLSAFNGTPEEIEAQLAEPTDDETDK